MTDRNEGLILAFLDGELDPSEAHRVAAEMDRDPAFREEVEERRFRSSTVDARLALEPGPTAAEVETARQAIALRLGESRRSRHGGPGRGLFPRPTRAALARAAGLVLLAAGAVSAAIPGSPVRSWIVDRLGSADTTPPSAPAPAGPSIESPPGPVGEMSVEVREGASLRVRLERPAPGSVVEVHIVAGNRAVLRAETDGGYRSGPELLAANGPRGLIRVELPRSLQAAVEVDGRSLVTVRDGRLLPSNRRLEVGEVMRFELESRP